MPHLIENTFIPNLSNTQWVQFLDRNPSLYKDFALEIGRSYPGDFIYDNKTYQIPYRLGYQDNTVLKNQDEAEMIMSYCFMSRNQNGFVREKYLKKLLDPDIMNKYPYVIAYILRPLGEYVDAIWDFLADNRTILYSDAVNNFVRNNPLFIDKNKQRNFTYSHIYYRSKIKRPFISKGHDLLTHLEELTKANPL